MFVCRIVQQSDYSPVHPSVCQSIHQAWFCVFVFSISLSTCLPIYTFFCLSVLIYLPLSVCLLAFLSACLSVYLCACMSVCPFVPTSVCLSVCLLTCLSIRLLSICLSIHHPSIHLLSVCLSVSPFIPFAAPTFKVKFLFFSTEI